MRRPISILITAYKSEDFIEQCLDSIESQTYFKDFDTYEILLGIDGCPRTLSAVSKIKNKYRNLKVIMMTNNVGTYITTNTLLSLAIYDRILRFDSDDWMFPNLIETISRYDKDYDKVSFHCENVYISGPKDNTLNTLASNAPDGIALYKRSVFDNFGGFLPWRCAADTEFKIRSLYSITRVVLEDKLFYRRIHKDSLTQDPNTGFGSTTRKKHLDFIMNNPNFMNYVPLTTSSYYEPFRRRSSTK